MNLSKFFRFIFILTFMSLIYINMQMRIIELAYKGKIKEEQIKHLVDENGDVTYSILKMKSANNIGHKMLAENSDMQFMDPNSIVLVPSSYEFNKEILISSEKEKKNSLLSLLSAVSSAQAQIHKTTPNQ